MSALVKCSRRTAGSILLLALFAAPVAAHHSYALFDRSKPVSVTGVVKSWRYMNPHSSLDVVGVGDRKTYQFEGGAINILYRVGIKSGSVRVGDKITVQYFPLRDGRPGGQFTSLTLADGKKYDTFPQQR